MERGGERANPHPFIIHIFYGLHSLPLRCFAMHLLYMDLNSMYMHMLMYCYCYSFELFVNC